MNFKGGYYASRTLSSFFSNPQTCNGDKNISFLNKLVVYLYNYGCCVLYNVKKLSSV